MPVMDGYEATVAIREWESKQRRLLPAASATCTAAYPVPIFALTANTVAGASDRCLAIGMDLFLTKPLASKQLQAALKAAAATHM